MIIFGMPLFAWLGAVTFILIITQIFLGVAMTVYGKAVFKFHRINAIIIIILAIIHVSYALLFLLKGFVF